MVGGEGEASEATQGRGERGCDESLMMDGGTGRGLPSLFSLSLSLLPHLGAVDGEVQGLEGGAAPDGGDERGDEGGDEGPGGMGKKRGG